MSVTRYSSSIALLQIHACHAAKFGRPHFVLYRIPR